MTLPRLWEAFPRLGASLFGKPTENSRLKNLRRSEALFIEAEKMGLFGSWEHDLTTGEDNWSVNLCRMLEIDPFQTKVSETLFWDLLHPDDREGVRATIDFGMLDGQEYEYRSRFLLPSGLERTLHVYGKPILDRDKKVVRRIGLAQDVTTMVEAQRALLQSEKLYRDLVESSNDLICTHDLDGRLLSMNELPAGLLGYRPEELIGKCIPDLLNSHVEFAEYINRLEKHGTATGLMSLTTKTGERRVWEYRNTIRTNGAKSLVRGMARDVTERFKIQKDLRDTSARLEAVLDSIDEVAIEFDGAGTFLEIWTTNESRLIRPRARLIGRQLADVIGEDWEGKYREVFSRVLRTGNGEDVEYSLPLTDGPHWFLCRVTPIISADGKARSVCVLAREITERKRVEQSLRLFRELIDRSNDAIEVIDPNTLCFLDVNQGACDMLGYTREELLSMSVYDIDLNLTRSRDAQFFRQSLETRSLMAERFYRRKDGSVLPVEINVSLTCELGKSYLVAVGRDISDRKHNESAIRRLTVHLLKTQDVERRIVAREIHDGIGSHITAFALAFARVRRFLDHSNPEHARIIAEFRSLLHDAAAEIRAVSYLLHPPSLEEHGLESALKLLTSGFTDRTGIKTSISLPASLGRFDPEVEVTLFRVTQEALNNIYQHSGSKTAEVSLSRNSDEVVLRIADRGRGHAKTHHENDTGFSVGITGMRERIRNLGGTFSIVNSPNAGFVVQAQIRVG
jgi:PAS domain S-box-containing protein